MQISLRSQMIAGTTALVGATAIAMTPVAPAVNLPALSTSNAVALAAFQSPLATLSQTLAQASSYLLDETSSVLNADNWPGANFGTTFGVPPANWPLLPAALETDALGGYSKVGLIPQIIDDALPILRQLGYNGSDYLDLSTQALFAATDVFFQGLWTAAGELLQFDIQGAISTLIGSVSFAGNALLGAGTYVATGVITRAQAVLGVVIGELPTLLGATVAQISTVIGAVVNVFSNVVGALSTANPIENAWNAAVEGLLGPTGVPGVLNNLTIGAGVQTGPIVTPDAAGIAGAFVPSTRTLVQGAVKAIQGALATPVPLTAAATPAAARAAAAAPAEAVAAEAAPAAEATAGDNDSAAAEATSAAPAASAAADDSAAEAPKAKASKAGAARSGR